MKDSPNIRAFLAYSSLFSDLDEEALTWIANESHEIRATKGRTLFTVGDPCAGLHLMIYGRAKIVALSQDGKEKVVEILTDSHSFGEDALLLNQPYNVSAETLSTSLLLHIPKRVVTAVLESHTEFCRNLMARMARRQYRLVDDVVANSLCSGTQRIINYLLQEQPDDRESAADLCVTLPTTKGAIASRLNLTQEHFSRILHDLSSQGLIAIHGRRIQIVEPARLQQFESRFS